VRGIFRWMMPDTIYLVLSLSKGAGLYCNRSTRARDIKRLIFSQQ